MRRNTKVNIIYSVAIYMCSIVLFNDIMKTYVDNTFTIWLSRFTVNSLIAGGFFIWGMTIGVSPEKGVMR